jgi:hypothetical protein
VHATDLHPRRALAALAALALALAAIVLITAFAGSDLSIGGGDRGSAAPATTLTGSSAAQGDPLASPWNELPPSVRWPPAR